jgi:plasmid stabilization system protein ParE
MIYTINLIPFAKQDIESVIDYIETHLFAPVAAENFAHGIYNRIAELGTFASIHAVSHYRDVLKYGKNARHIMYKGFVIIYTIHLNKVIIHRIIHSSHIIS